MTDGRGNTYVNNIGFDFPDEEFVPGLIALVRPDGSVHQVAEGLAFPNGMAVTPDNSTLIVAESYGGALTAYDIAADGGLTRRRVWADLDGAAPDGILQRCGFACATSRPSLPAPAQGRRFGQSPAARPRDQPVRAGR